MLRATLEAIKNKNKTQPPAPLSNEPVKKSKLDQVHLGAGEEDFSDSQDETEIMALLDEIDCINPSIIPASCKPAIPNPPPIMNIEANDLGGRGSNTAHFLSSDVDFGSETGFETVSAPIEGTTTTTATTDATAERVDYEWNHQDFHQFLPLPFFPENFTISDWKRNIGELRNRELPGWSRRVMFSSIHSIPVGGKAPCLFAMIKESTIIGREISAILLDESGEEISATIHEKVFHRQKIRAHFGLGLLLKDPTVFAIHPAAQEKHLIVAPDNVVRIYSNVHHA